MTSTNEDWSVDANEAVRISIVQPGARGVQTLHEFHPKFTYPIVGEAEQIFGYKGLDINISYSAHSVEPHISISYNKKFNPVGTTTALDLNKTFAEYLPRSAFDEGYEARIENEDASSWTPPGECVSTYKRGGSDYEVWAGSLGDKAVRDLVEKIQIFILFFIEAGSFLNLDDVAWTLDRWRVYLVYQKAAQQPTPNGSPYSFVGYATTYRFYRFQKAAPAEKFTFPPTESITPTKLSSRLRISQFVITPPYQRGGHGSALYKAIYGETMADATITELTVEDPSEEFDKLRDMNDFDVLEPQFSALPLKINSSPFATSERGRVKRVPTSTLLPTTQLQAIQTKNKIANRQFARMVEMYLLASIPFPRRASGGANMTALTVRGARNPNPDDRNYYWWRCLLKQRIIKKNKDQLQQVPLEERHALIEDSARGQEDEYEGLIMAYALRREAAERNRNGNGAESTVPRKRKVIEEDDEDDEDGDAESTGSKKART